MVKSGPGKRFSLQPSSTASKISLCGNFAAANFGPGEILRVRIFAIAKFRQNEISLQWMRNFAEMTAKFRLTRKKFASALTKFRGEISSNFRENKERKTPNFVCISFAQYCTLKTDQNLTYIALFKKRNKPQNVLNISRDTSNMASDTLST